MGLTHYDKTTSILCKGVIFAYFHPEGNSLALKELSNINFNGYAIHLLFLIVFLNEFNRALVIC